MSVTNPCPFFVLFFSTLLLSFCLVSHTLSHQRVSLSPPCCTFSVQSKNSVELPATHWKMRGDSSFLSFFPFLFPLPIPGPHFVAVNNKNEIVVTDFHNHSVKVWLDETICIHLKMVKLRCFDWMNQQEHMFPVVLSKQSFFLSDKNSFCVTNRSLVSYFSCRCTTQMGSSCINLAPTEREMASSTLQQAWLWTPMAISSSLTGATVGFRFAPENRISFHSELQLSLCLILLYLCHVKKKRCSTAPGPSCLTLTRRQTLFMDRRGWP